MTRSFGNNMPFTMLSPVIDFFNHNKNGVNKFFYNQEAENDKETI